MCVYINESSPHPQPAKQLNPRFDTIPSQTGVYPAR